MPEMDGCETRQNAATGNRPAALDIRGRGLTRLTSRHDLTTCTSPCSSKEGLIMQSVSRDASMPMRNLRLSEVHLYILRIIPGQSLLPEKYSALLDDEERAHIAAFVFDEDRRHYFAAHLLLRSLLGEYTQTAPSNLRLSRNSHGKPGLAQTGNGRRVLQFSLSHTRGLACLALTEHFPVGVDAEYHRELHDLEGVAAEVCTDFELAGLSSHTSGGSRTDDFLSLWTLKEAYVKARGMGLSIPLKSFGFVRGGSSGGSLRLRAVHSDDKTDRWQFALFAVDDRRFSLSVAMETAERRDCLVRVREMQMPDVTQNPGSTLCVVSKAEKTNIQFGEPCRFIELLEKQWDACFVPSRIFPII